MAKPTFGTRATGHPSLRIRPETRKDLVQPGQRCPICGQLFSNTAKHPVSNAE